DRVRAILANQTVDAPLEKRPGAVDESDGHLAPDRLRGQDPLENRRACDLREALTHLLDRPVAGALLDRQRGDERRDVGGAIPSLEHAVQKNPARAIR